MNTKELLENKFKEVSLIESLKWSNNIQSTLVKQSTTKALNKIIPLILILVNNVDKDPDILSKFNKMLEGL